MTEAQRVEYWRNKPGNRERAIAITKQWRLKIRNLIFDLYGGKCQCCGETQFLFLELHHKHNDGKQHRALLKQKGGTGFYKKLLDLEQPDPALELLCSNCHTAITRTGSCPHAANK